MNILFKEYGECVLAIIAVVISLVMFTKVFGVLTGLLQVGLKSFMG